MAGSFEWEEDDTVMRFVPDDLYQRGERYSVHIPSDASSKGGAVLTANIGNYVFYAASELFVVSTEPANGGLLSSYRGVEFNFNTPIETDNLKSLFSVSPDMDFGISSAGNKVVYIRGNFAPEEEYTITALSGITDIWGDSLDQNYQLTFRGAPLDANFTVSTFKGDGVMFVNPDNPGIAAQVVNVDRVDVQTASLPLEEFIYLDSEADYDTKQNYQPAQSNSVAQNLDILRNRNQQVGIGISASGSLTPGLYWVELIPSPAPNYSYPQRFFAVASHVQMVYKVGTTDALVWALDTRTNARQPMRR